MPSTRKKCSLKKRYFSFQFLSTVSLFKYLSVSFKYLFSPSISPEQDEKDLVKIPKFRKSFCSPWSPSNEDTVLCALRWKREVLVCNGQVAWLHRHRQREPLGRVLPPLATPQLPAVLATAATPLQAGHRVARTAGEEERQMAGFPPSGRWEADLDGACVRVDQQSSPMPPAVEPGGAQSHAVHLGDLGLKVTRAAQ